MKQRITPDQLESLSEAAQKRLADWYERQELDESQLVHVYIPEEKDDGYKGVFEGEWHGSYDFTYPRKYEGYLNNHKGTILPLLSIGEMLSFLTEHTLMGYFILTQPPYKAISLAFRVGEQAIGEPPIELCDALWVAVKEALESEQQ